MTRAYALQFTDFVIHVNQTGRDDIGRYWGGSVIYGPDAAIIVCKGPRDEPAVVVGDRHRAAGPGPARPAAPARRAARSRHPRTATNRQERESLSRAGRLKNS